MLNNVMPKRSEFFNLLAAHTDRLVAGANATLRLISGLGTHAEQDAGLIEEVNVNETSADEIKAQFIRMLYESFTTPINRDQLHTLIRDLDRVLDTLQSVANAVNVYHIPDSTPAARTMASLAADACLRLNRAVIALGESERSKETMDLCKAIDQIESKGDKIMRTAITKLFKEGGDVWAAMKLKEFYVLQEAVIDYCEDAAKTIEEILIENS